MEGCSDSVSEHVQGTKGLCDISGYHMQGVNGGIVTDFKIKGENEWRFKGDHGKDPYQQEHDDLFAAIRNDTPYAETLEYGAYSTMTAILGRLATYSGKVISWDDAINSPLDSFPKVLAWDAETPTKPDANGRYPIPVPGKFRAV
jgi:phenylpropionate dioxygenase-like ring-hydroxylating dioxygenase large terminal subunit